MPSLSEEVRALVDQIVDGPTPNYLTLTPEERAIPDRIKKLEDVAKAAEKPGFQGAPWLPGGHLSTTTVMVARDWYEGVRVALAALKEGK